jgi:predicted DNA-binding protein (UPF0251 family)
MPRPPKPRFVEFVPSITYFKPIGVPLSMLDEICLGIDELEALRLKEMEGLDQEECARRMNLSQSTFQRMLSAARAKLVQAVIEGKALRIEGGRYKVIKRRFACHECGHKWENVSPLSEDMPLQCPKCGSHEFMPERHRGRGCGWRRDD